ncbi:MAG TPA: hypothetical protein VFA87_01340 [Rhizomicrobium sp.]|nr:hypothetical protein [Rhizomicrobium sp.]
MKTNTLFVASILTASLAASLAATTPASAGGFMGYSTYEGRTTTVAGNGEGSRMVFGFGAGGMRMDMRQRPMPGTIQIDDGHGGWMDYHRPARSDVMGSSIYRGRETVVTRNADGSHTVNATENGMTTSEVHREAPRGTIQVDDGNGGWKPYVAPPKSNVLGSSTYEGVTKVVTKDDIKPLPKGISVDDGKGGWKPYVAPPKSNVLGSSTYNGVTTVMTKDDIKPLPKGISVDDGKGGWKPYVAPPKSKLIGSTTFDGKTTTVTDNGDGTHTVTTTENGMTSSETHAAHR